MKRMTEIHPLEMKDRPVVEEYRKRCPPEVSELTFTNLFIWLNSRPIFFAEVGGSMVFLTRTESAEEAYLVLGHPLGEVSPLRVAEALDVSVAGFIRIPEGTAKTFGAADLVITQDRDNADYVYRVQDLANLAGRRYSKKRNLVKQCLTAHPCQYEPMTPEIVSECLDMQDRWCEARQCKREPGLCAEYVAIRQMFDHFLELHQLIGGAIRIDGVLQAYAVGEELNPATAVWHFEKAMPGFRGLGQLINQWFARHALKGFEFVNREQDLGIPGLRQAKMSYYPHHMVAKYNAWFPDRLDETQLVDPHECARHGVEEGA